MRSPRLQTKLRLLANGVNVAEISAAALDCIAKIQLDDKLAEYYKLMTELNIKTNNVDKASKTLVKYRELLLGIEPQETEDSLQKTLDELDNMKVLIDLKSLPTAEDKLILRKKGRH